MIDTLPTYAKTSGEVNILLGDTNEAPYSELAPGRILSTFNAAVLGQLIKTDQNYNLIPGHLESWNWDFHTSEYVLKMRPGLKFHNGKPASAKDLEFSLLRGFFSAQQSFYRTYLSNVDGVNSIRAGSPFKTGLVSGVKIIDELTLRVKLSHPNPSFLLGGVYPVCWRG
jgi:ABC-type transport system substrate-binding protein